MKKHDSLKQLNLNAVLDAIPIAFFIIDKKNRILDINQYAKRIADINPKETLMRMCGEALHCLRAKNAPQGCGTTEYCPDCVINNTITDSCSGQTIVKRKAELLVQKGGQQYKSVFLISASPFIENDENLTLFSLEDISELSLLRDLLPICSNCKKIRNDKEYWETIEEYMNHHFDTKVSHGICPDCSDQLYGEEDWYIQMKKDNRGKAGL